MCSSEAGRRDARACRHTEDTHQGFGAPPPGPPAAALGLMTRALFQSPLLTLLHVIWEVEIVVQGGSVSCRARRSSSLPRAGMCGVAVGRTSALEW